MESDASAILCGALAALFVLLTGLNTASISALGRLTRAGASEAYANGERSGVRLVRIASMRMAAIAACNSLRFITTAGYGLCLTLALGSAIHQPLYLALGVLGITLGVVLLSFVISPAKLGVAKPIEVLGAVSLPLLLVARLWAPIIRERDQSPEEAEQEKEDQLAMMVERVSESDALDEDERELLQSVFDMGTTITREVMVPRTDMIAIRNDETLDKAISLFSRSGYSRIPVVGESVDDLQGIVYLKDVIRRVHHREDVRSLPVSEVMRDPLFVPETVVVDDLLRQMQSQQIHIAMVVDEYGGIAGLVTIEDLVEELVGEIADEHDKAEPVVEKIADGIYRVPARLPISELGELFGQELDDDDVDTVGGLMAKLLGRVPIAGAEATVAGIRLEAERFGGRRRRLSTLIATSETREEKADA